MDDVSQDEDEEPSRKKRSRQETAEISDSRGQGGRDGEDIRTPPTQSQKHTPPLPRRISGTPSQGVEMQIPSRPATPVAVRTEVSRTRSNSNLGDTRSALGIQNDAPPVAGFTSAVAGAPEAAAATAPSGDKAQSEEDLFAAFEADLLKNDNAPRAPTIDAPAEAVIAAPAVTADELAAQSVEEERAKRRLAADVQIDDEREDAARALEEEFEDMEELEARVRRLKERREALRHQTQTRPPLEVPSALDTVKENADEGSNGKENVQEEDDDSADDDDEDADDWAGFRFRR
jgi:zinc finger protein 830